MYIIDKVVRQRTSKGEPFGKDNSELLQQVQLEAQDKENEFRNIQRLVEGKPNISDDEDCDISQPLSTSSRFDGWCKRKEMEQRLKEKLVEDAKVELKKRQVQSDKVKQQQKNRDRNHVDEWRRQKDQEYKDKKK